MKTSSLLLVFLSKSFHIGGHMLRYILQRVVAMMITLFLVVTILFFLVRLMPGSIIDNPELPEDTRRAIEAKYHLDKPLHTQYLYFMTDALQGDFGRSISVQPGSQVFDVLRVRIPVTLQLSIASLLLTIPFGLAFGIIAALKKNTMVDHIISLGVVLFISIPPFVFASLMQFFIAYKLDWLPIMMATGPLFSKETWISLIMPILALSFSGIAMITRYMRAELAEALNTDYMLLAKTKGLTQLQATLRHAIRNSFIPLANVIIPMFFGVLGGSMVIENIFGVPGMGRLMVTSINANDHPLTIAIVFFYTVIGLVSVLTVDLSYGIIDPRIRIGGKK